MIFLIDDNKADKRRNEMGINFVDDNIFDGFLFTIEKIKKDSDLSFLNNAKCILIHTTTDDVNNEGEFTENSRTNVIKVIEDISDFGSKIPLVMFSNQMAESSPDTYNYELNPNCIYQIKKNLFYERLYDFIDFFKKTGVIELRIIALGKKYKATEISRYSKILIESLIKYSFSELFKPNYVQLSIFRQYFSLSNLGSDFDSFINDLEDNPITVSKFIDNISQIVESFNEYDENIYDWQK